jgi:3-oxoacyl-[acyl-carrier-protein] synthase III
VVCDQHGGAAPQVRRRAAERLIMTADQAAQMLVRMMKDTEVPFGVRAKIAQDLLDRAGLVAAQVHKIVPTTEDPIMRFFEEALQRPEQLGVQPAARSDASDREPPNQQP